MKYRVWDEEDKKERTIHEAITELGEVGTVRKVWIRKGGKQEPHHFRVLEVIK